MIHTCLQLTEKYLPTLEQVLTAYYPDTTPPNLQAFTLYNANNGNLHLRFDEPIAIDTLNISHLTLQSNTTATNPGFSAYTLRHPPQLIKVLDSKQVLQLQIAAADLSAIKQDKRLAVSRQTTYLTLTRGFIQDTSGNQLAPIMALPLGTWMRSIHYWTHALAECSSHS